METYHRMMAQVLGRILILLVIITIFLLLSHGIWAIWYLIFVVQYLVMKYLRVVGCATNICS